MLFRATDIQDMTLHARDAEVGRVRDVYFDDGEWRIRYLVGDPGGWLLGRKVLLATETIIGIDDRGDDVHLRLTRQEIAGSPPIASDAPVSRRMEARLARHYGWPVYWDSPLPPMTGPDVVPPRIHPPHLEAEIMDELLGAGAEFEDRGLRSADEVRGYGVQTPDGALGHVGDLVFDTHTWIVRYLLVDTRRILPGRQILIPPWLVDDVSWETGSVLLAATGEELRTAPEFDGAGQVGATEVAATEAHFTRYRPAAGG